MKLALSNGQWMNIECKRADVQYVFIHSIFNVNFVPVTVTLNLEFIQELRNIPCFPSCALLNLFKHLIALSFYSWFELWVLPMKTAFVS